MQQLDLFGSADRLPPAIISKAKKQKAEKQLPCKELPVFLNKPSITHEEIITATANNSENNKPEQEQKSTGNTGKRGRKAFKEMEADLVMVEVPEDDILFGKQYYSMCEVSGWFHVNQSLLRYWENEFDILKPRKNRKGNRLFRPEDIKNLQLIYHLLRQQKLSIEGAKQYLKENKHKADMQMQLIQSLTKMRSFLLEWKANLEP